mgnify:CR=1 FL=1
MLDMQHKLHLFGRYGITLFALSGLDIALWDLAGKVAGQSLCHLFGGRKRDDIIGYSSLFNYSDPELVAAKTKQSLDDGFDYVKLHETGVKEVSAARDAAGDGVPLMVDTNCPWTPEEAKRAELFMRRRTITVPGTCIEIDGTFTRPPLERTGTVEQLYHRARAIAERLGHELREGSTGGGSDGNFTAALGVPTLDGLGAIGAGAHALHEHIDVGGLSWRAALLAALVAEVQAGD